MLGAKILVPLGRGVSSVRNSFDHHLLPSSWKAPEVTVRTLFYLMSYRMNESHTHMKLFMGPKRENILFNQKLPKGQQSIGGKAMYVLLNHLGWKMRP